MTENTKDTDHVDSSRESQSSLQHLETRLEQYRSGMKREILEARIAVSERRVTVLLAFLALLGIVYPVWNTNRNAEKIDQAIAGMETRFKELAGEYLRKPDIVCEIDGRSLSGQQLAVATDPRSSQSLVIRNNGDASAGFVYVHLLLKHEAPLVQAEVSGGIGDDSIRLDMEPSRDPRFAQECSVFRIAAFHPNKEYHVRFVASTQTGAETKREVPALLKVYYDAPQPLDVPFNMEFVSTEQ